MIARSSCCILSKFYIKPQLFGFSIFVVYVVSYRNSTSNHNQCKYTTKIENVVSYRNSTSNHNILDGSYSFASLYLIEILHQTTTSMMVNLKCSLLYLIEILHQTTTAEMPVLVHGSCILSKFYIKPQQRFEIEIPNPVVSYRNSTSNHNMPSVDSTLVELYLIEILHQTTTSFRRLMEILSCILSKFYIKPQLVRNFYGYSQCCILSKFYIKPQQKQMTRFSESCCILSKFYIKPQLAILSMSNIRSCILSKFYIKPQHHYRFYGRLPRCILSKFYIKPQLQG